MSVFLISFSFLTLVWFINNYFKYKRINEAFDKLPSLPSLPILGHLLYFKNLNAQGALQFGIKIAEENNGLVALKLGPMLKCAVITDRHLVATLCKSNNVRKSNGYKIFGKFIGKTVFTTNGDEFKRYKTILAPIFHINLLKNFIQSYQSTTDVLIEQLQTSVGYPVDICHFVELWALDVILETGAGLSLDVQRNSKSEYVSKICEILRIICGRVSNPIKYFDFIYIFSRDYWKEIECVKFINEYTKMVMNERIAAMNENTSTDENLDAGSKRKTKKSIFDFIHNNKSDLSHEEICNHIKGILFAGHDTVNTALGCCLYLLSKHEDIQEKLFSEIREICGDNKTKESTFEDLQKMEYLEMVLKESMRLYPPAIFFAKYTMEDIEHKGQVIPKDVEIVILVTGIHMREEYFPNPHVFNPERFDPEKEDIKPFTYLPFGAGTRTCLGYKAAMLQMKVCVSKLLRNYKLLPVEGFQLNMLPHLVQKPDSNGIQVILAERKY